MHPRPIIYIPTISFWHPRTLPNNTMSHQPSQRRSRRSSTNNESVQQQQQVEEEEEEDVLAELLGILSKGSSHWYSINGETSCKVSLCSLLGFFQPMDYYAYLVSKGLAAYKFNSKKREMVIEIKINKWEQFLSNKDTV